MQCNFLMFQGVLLSDNDLGMVMSTWPTLKVFPELHHLHGSKYFFT